MMLKLRTYINVFSCSLLFLNNDMSMVVAGRYRGERNDADNNVLNESFVKVQKGVRRAMENKNNKVAGGGGNTANAASGTIVENYPCVPWDDVKDKQALNPYTDDECRDNSCSGCCREYNFLMCDTASQSPYMRCVCNDRTATKSPTSSPTLPMTSAPTPPTQAFRSNNTTAPTTAPVASPTTAPVAPPTTAPVASPTTAPVAPPTTAPVNPPTTSPVAPPTTAPSTAPVAPPTTAPVAPPTTAPSTAPVVSPTIAPVATPPPVATGLPTVALTNAPTQLIAAAEEEASSNQSAKSNPADSKVFGSNPDACVNGSIFHSFDVVDNKCFGPAECEGKSGTGQDEVHCCLATFCLCGNPNGRANACVPYS